jgi:hypothetical protein
MTADADGCYYDDHDRAQRQRKCQEKKVYGTLLLAMNAAWLYGFSVYSCAVCTKLHLSRQVSRPTAIVCVL